MIFQDFSVTHILREIDFAEFRSSKMAFFPISGALTYVDLVNFSIEKCKNPKNSKFRASKCVKMAFLNF